MEAIKSRIKINRKVFAFPYIVFMLVFIILPLFFILINAFMNSADQFTFNKFRIFFTDGASIPTFLRSLIIGVITTGLCFLIGYPVSYVLSRPYYKTKPILVMLFILPMWINLLLRTLATKMFLAIFGSDFGLGTVIFGMVYNFLPFMIMPIYTTLINIDKSFIEAAQDLGASPLAVIFKVVLPLSMPGIISGITMVFVPTISTYVISQMLSNGSVTLFGDLINFQFSNSVGDKGVGSVMSIVMLIIVIISNSILNRFNKGGISSKGGLW